MRPGLPSIAADASAPPAEALAAVRGAARARGRTLAAACVDGAREAAWRELLRGGGEGGEGGGGGGEGGEREGEGRGGCEQDAAVALFTTAGARDWLVAAEAATEAATVATAAAEGGGGDGGDGGGGGDGGSGAEEGDGQGEGPAAGADGLVDDLVTCLFSFGSTGQPKPLWFDATRCAKTTPDPNPAPMR